jgi:hypothetical protein
VLFIRQDILLDTDIPGLGQFDIAFYGRNDLDDRSEHSVKLTRSLARQQQQVSYNPETFELSVGSFAFKADSLEDLPRRFPAASIVIDATTMEFPEILLLLHAYYGLGRRPRCGFIYVEPERYKRREPDEIAARGAEFNLSSGFRAKNAIPPFAVMLSGTQKAHLISFLGFEGSRLARVLNDDDGHFFKQVTIVFGVPPFQATWDLHALMANHRLLGTGINTQVRFCSANTPRAAYLLLKEAHKALPGSRSDRLAVAPFGTKPMALGAALYCVEASQLRVVYDHPVRVAGRTEGVHRTLWYEVDMNR